MLCRFLLQVADLVSYACSALSITLTVQAIQPPVKAPTLAAKMFAPSYLRDQVAGPEDNWAGITDPKARRKIQNRLNQRARRQKLRKTIQQPLVACHHGDARLIRRSYADIDPSLSEKIRSRTATSEDIERIAHIFYFGSQSTDPKADMLLTLVQFNVFRALLHNTCHLDFDMSWLQYAADSIFNKTDGKFNQAAPPGLQPTALQRSIPHHPWLDLLPFPALRDNMLRVYDTWSGEDELCDDIVGWCHAAEARLGLIVWGEPWDPLSWEVTDGFAKKYGWLLTGCDELMKATNAWRAIRDEQALTFEVERTDLMLSG